MYMFQYKFNNSVFDVTVLVVLIQLIIFFMLQYFVTSKLMNLGHIYNNNKQCHNKQKMKEHVQCADMLEQIKEKTEAERSQFLMDNRSTFVHDTCYNKSDFDKLLNNV